MRPTTKFILTNHSSEAMQKSETLSNNARVQELMKEKHSCLSCTYFLPSPQFGGATCRNPRVTPRNKPVKHYNICALHGTGRTSD